MGILCFHGPQLYTAKVLKRTINKTENDEKTNEKPLYYVHYHGWNKQWDEWVTADRCLKHTPQNIEKQKEMKNKTKNNKNNTNNKKKQIKDVQDIEQYESDTNNINESTSNNNKQKLSPKQEKDEQLQLLLDKQNKLKQKDLDDLDLNQKIKIHRNKKENQNKKINTKKSIVNIINIKITMKYKKMIRIILLGGNLRKN